MYLGNLIECAQVDEAMTTCSPYTQVPDFAVGGPKLLAETRESSWKDVPHP